METIISNLFNRINISSSWLNMMYDCTNKIIDHGLEEIMKAFIPVGIMMAMIHISKEMLEKTTLKNIDLEQILKMFMKLVVAFALISNSPALVTGMNTFSNAIYESFKIVNDIEGEIEKIGNEKILEDLLSFVTDQASASTDLLSKNEQYLAVTDATTAIGTFFDVIPAIMTTAIVFLGQVYYMFAFTLASYSRAMNIGYKAMYAPIALSNITGYSTRSAAISYLKELLALFMQLPVAYLGLVFSVKLINYMTSIETNVSRYPFVILAVFILGGRWVSKSGTISKSLFT